MDRPRKIMWNTFFYFSFHFSMAFALVNLVLTFFVVIIVVLSYSHSCKPHSIKFHKLPRPMMASNSRVES